MITLLVFGSSTFLNSLVAFAFCFASLRFAGWKGNKDEVEVAVGKEEGAGAGAPLKVSGSSLRS